MMSSVAVLGVPNTAPVTLDNDKCVCSVGSTTLSSLIVMV